VHESGELKLKEKKRAVEKGFVENAKKGDLISTHWNFAVEKIDEDQFASIKKYTENNLLCMNKN